MAIINDYAAIAQRLRELKSIPQDQQAMPDYEMWREKAHDVARIYVENRRKSAVHAAIFRRVRRG